MDKKSLISIKPLRFLQISLAISIIEGIIVLVILFLVHSDIENIFFMGYSLRRLLIGFLIFSILVLLTMILIGTYKSSQILPLIGNKLLCILKNEPLHIFIQTILTLVLISFIVIVVIYYFPAFQRVIPFLQDFSPFESIIKQVAVIIIWISLIIYKIIVFNFLYAKGEHQRFSSFSEKAALISWTITGYVFAGFVVFHSQGQAISVNKLLFLAWNFLIISIWFSIWTFLEKYNVWTQRYLPLFEGVSIWLVTFLISLSIANWLNGLNTPPDNYFNLLAESILHGRIFISEPLQTFDLTFFNGKWFVPFPPFPAFLLAPFIAIWNVGGLNTVTFSLALASTTTLLMFLIIRGISENQWIKLSKSGAVWLTVMFYFGTVEWWLSTTSRVWHFSQICTVFCCALAFWCCLKRLPAWVVGICLAAAVLSRPNVLVLWPALVAIKIQYDQTESKIINWKRIIRWSLWSAIPVVVGVGILLGYNYLRFGDFLDFGYTTISGSEWTVSRAQTYGIFSPYFIPYNLYWMFAAFLPRLIAQCGYYLPRGNGMSFFLATPALIYVLRRFKASWWTIGCWVSILLSVFLLAMYHNNGASQYSYRYVMDFIIPIIMLIAYNAGKKISFPLKILVLLSVFINYYGLISWFRSPC